MNNTIAVAVAALFLFACARPAEHVSPSTNPNFPVERLFTHDGCTGFRFRDEGRYHYYVRCGNDIATSQSVSCGKNCTQEEKVVTVDGGLR